MRLFLWQQRKNNNHLIAKWPTKPIFLNGCERVSVIMNHGGGGNRTFRHCEKTPPAYTSNINRLLRFSPVRILGLGTLVLPGRREGRSVLFRCFNCSPFRLLQVSGRVGTSPALNSRLKICVPFNKGIIKPWKKKAYLS